MEYLRRLQECHEKHISIKQAFFRIGMTDDGKPLKQLKDQEEFSALVNWAINKLPLFQSMDLRLKVSGIIYETLLYKCGGQVRVGKIRRKDQVGAIAYDWPEGAVYDSLKVDMITASVYRADIINAAKMNGKLLTRQEIEKQENSQREWHSAIQETIPKIKLVQTERNCWDVVLTEEERELIEEFLEV